MARMLLHKGKEGRRIRGERGRKGSSGCRQKGGRESREDAVGKTRPIRSKRLLKRLVNGINLTDEGNSRPSF